ncbi:MAG: hypothetical protein U0836_10955 [Pirellulales bacterium]
MHIAAQLEAALEQARRQGFRLRSEWLGGAGGGACEIRGERWLFVDLALEPSEQLELVLAALAAWQPAHAETPASRRLAG